MRVKNYKKCYLYHPFLSIRNLDIKIVFVKHRPAVGEYISSKKYLQFYIYYVLFIIPSKIYNWRSAIFYRRGF